MNIENASKEDIIAACNLIACARKTARKISGRSFERMWSEKLSIEGGSQLSSFVVVKYDPVPDSVMLASGLRYCKCRIYPYKNQPCYEPDNGNFPSIWFLLRIIRKLHIIYCPKIPML